MGVWTTTEEAMAAFRKLAADLEKTDDDLAGALAALKRVYEEQQEGLGYHSKDIGDLIAAMEGSRKDGKRELDRLILALTRAAALRGAIQQTSRYGAAASGGAPSAEAATGAPAGQAGGGPGAEQPGTDAPTPEERTIFELTVLEEQLDLTDGEAGIVQLGGFHGEVKEQLRGTGYHSHHIPAKVLLDVPMDALPTVALRAEDHRDTSSFGGRMGSRAKPLFPTREQGEKHGELVKEDLGKGFLAEIIRDEILEIRRECGTRYDGGLKQYIAAMKEFIRKNGVPKIRQ